MIIIEIVIDEKEKIGCGAVRPQRVLYFLETFIFSVMTSPS